MRFSRTFIAGMILAGAATVLFTTVLQTPVSADSDSPIIGTAKFPLKNNIDRLVMAQLQENKIEASAVCTDEEFVRRVYLDVCGIIPPAVEVRAFLSDKSGDKRTKLIDRLLASPRYAEHFACMWSDLLREHSNAKPREGTDPGSYRDWIEDALVKNMPYDQFARALITASGSSDEDGAANFYLRDEQSRVETANTIATVFMGTRMACAQCHDHPFDKWTQNDFHSLMAFLGRVNVIPDQTATLLRVEKNKTVPDEARKALEPYFKEAHAAFEKEQAAKKLNNDMHDPAPGMAGPGMAMMMEAGKGREIIKELEKVLTPPQVQRMRNLLLNNAVRQVVERPNGEYKMPKEGDDKGRKGGGEVVPAVFAWDQSKKFAGPGSRRKRLSEYVVGSRQFAAVQVNRMFAQLMGRGIIDPPDDFREKNPPVNPELLNWLTDEFIAHKFDNKHILREILNSSTYQRSSQPTATNKDDTDHFSHHKVRHMTAEEMFDSILVATGHAEGMDFQQQMQEAKGEAFKNYLRGNKEKMGSIKWASDLPTPAKTGSFMNLFNQPDRESTTTRRDETGSVAQALEMLNGKTITESLRKSPVIKEIIAAKKTPTQAVTDLYQLVLSRNPTPTELRMTAGKLTTTPDREWLEDLNWALLNTREFCFVK